MTDKGLQAKLPETLSALLADRFAERFTMNASVCIAHGKGEESGDAIPPAAVIFPQNNDEVAFIVKACKSAGCPVIAFGAGSSLEGQLKAIHGGLCIDLSRMNHILNVSTADMDCHVQAGVTRKQLNAHLRDQGLFFPIDPGYNATIGGMSSTRASGTNAVRYGTMRDVVMGLTLVTPNGDIVRLGNRARKSSTGYDLVRLMIGAEGTLGIITEVRLRLFGTPDHICATVLQFPTLDNAVGAVIAILQMGLPVARIELLDEIQTKASISWSKIDYLDPAPTLFVEMHGTAAIVTEQKEILASAIKTYDGQIVRHATLAEERSRLWKARHEAYYAGKALAPGKANLTTDACVPISRLAEIILATSKYADELGLICPIVGHVGDGNFHANILYDANDEEETLHAKKLSDFVAEQAIKMEGTCSGEHGVGISNLKMVSREIGEAIHLMRAIKQALDPTGMMNPGKTVP